MTHESIDKIIITALINFKIGALYFVYSEVLNDEDLIVKKFN